jgi:hypothetical protein
MLTREADTGNGSVTSAAKMVAEHASALARLELKLALLELKGKVASLAVGIGLALTASILALFALGFAAATAAAAIATALATWLALLIVTMLFLLLAGLLGGLGLRAIKRGLPPLPEQAIAEAKLTTEAVKSDDNTRNAA